MEKIKVAIGIQARSTSKRLPGKGFKILTNQSILEHVVHSCEMAILYLKGLALPKKILFSQPYLLVPHNDEITRVWKKAVIVGSEDDVLSRYVTLQEITKANFIVRITADCPLLPHYVIAKMISLAAMNDYDYVSNVDGRCRTAPDGYDCEVMSAQTLKWLGYSAKGDDREHVTTLIRRETPSWCRQGVVVGFLDMSRIKISVDTLEDLKYVREELNRVEQKYERAVGIFGKRHVHRF